MTVSWCVPLTSSVQDERCKRVISPHAIIEPGAKIGANVSIGPWSYIGNDVEIGDGSIIGSHAVIKGPSKIGKNNRVFQFATLGEECQDKKYQGEDTTLIVGDNNVFRECVTVHRGTIQDKGETIIGSNNLFMNYVHVAHDCVVGDNVIMANNASIAGHVHLGDWAIMGGMSGAHQFVKIGAHAFVGASATVLKDIPPYVLCSGHPAKAFGLNVEGLKRRGFDKQTLLAIRRAYKAVFRGSETVTEAIEALNQQEQISEVQAFIDFIAHSERGIAK